MVQDSVHPQYLDHHEDPSPYLEVIMPMLRLSLWDRDMTQGLHARMNAGKLVLV